MDLINVLKLIVSDISKTGIRGAINRQLYYRGLAKAEDIYTSRLQEYYKMLSVDQRKKHLEKAYYEFFGKRIDLTNPVTYCEKIQWSKLFDTDMRRTQYADKIAVRDYVEQSIGKQYLIPCLGVWDTVDEINWNKLPDKFVLKTNHGCGTNIFCTNKSKLNIKETEEQINRWLSVNYGYTDSFELQYSGIKPRIYAEKYMIKDNMQDLPDYKFFCFDGKVFCSYIMLDYTFSHDCGKLGFFDRDFKLLPYHRADYQPITEQIPKPKNYELMVEIAEKLSKGINHVRVDLYNIEGEVYFGEMTFTTSGGFMHFIPEEFDRILGANWNIGK